MSDVEDEMASDDNFDEEAEDEDVGEEGEEEEEENKGEEEEEEEEEKEPVSIIMLTIFVGDVDTDEGAWRVVAWVG